MKEKFKFIKGKEYHLDEFYNIQKWVQEYFEPIDDDDLGAQNWICIKSIGLEVKLTEL